MKYKCCQITASHYIGCELNRSFVTWLYLFESFLASNRIKLPITSIQQHLEWHRPHEKYLTVTIGFIEGFEPASLNKETDHY